MSNEAKTFQFFRDKLVDHFKIIHSNLQILESGEIPTADVLDLYKESRTELQERILDLEKKEYRIAFVGGFNSGKSTLINAILGDYILPEASKALTSIPTYIKRSETDENEYNIHYLSRDDVYKVKRMYRKELAIDLGDASAINLGDDGLINLFERRVAAIQEEGRTSNLDVKLLEHYKQILSHEKKISAKIHDKSYVVPCSQEKAFELIQDDVEAAFIDKIEIRLKDLDIPPDVVIVDLPGVSVSNPRHREVTLDFIRKNAHAIVLVLSVKRVLDKDENTILKNYIGNNVTIQNKLFWVINQWDLVTEVDKKDVESDFEKMLRDFQITQIRSYRTSARDGLLSWLFMNNRNSLKIERLEHHMREYEKGLKHKYGDDHEVAYKLSQVGKIRDDLLDYLNAEIKKTTLKEMAESILIKAKRVATILRKEQEDHRHYLSELIDNEKRIKLEEYIEEKRKILTDEAKSTLRKMLDKVVDQQDEIEATRTHELWEHIEQTYSSNINLEGEFRKVMKMLGRKSPLYFEIETNVLTSINQLVKDKFVKVLKDGIGRVFDEYETLLDSFSKFISEELKGEYVSALDRDFKDKIIRENKRKVRDGFEMYASALISRLDSLMVWSQQSEDNLFKGLGIGSCDEVIAQSKAGLGNVKRYIDDAKSKINEIAAISSRGSWMGKKRKNEINAKKTECESILTNLHNSLSQFSANYSKIESLLHYAYPENPDPAQELTRIAKLVPKDIRDSEVWTKKATQFNDFLSNVYKAHMEKAVKELNEQSWLFVRDNLAETESQLNDILIKYVFQRLEKIVKSNVEQEYKLKRESKERLQELIGEHLKPVIEADRMLRTFVADIENANFPYIPLSDRQELPGGARVRQIK